MIEPDDRLAGDPVWELFPYPSPGAARPRRRLGLAVLAAALAAAWFLCPPLGVAATCLAVAARDFRAGYRLARAIPDKAGGLACSRFAHAWGAWKLGATAFALMFVIITVEVAVGREPGPPPAFLAAALLWLGGFAASAALTAVGLVGAFRSGMRVWIGAGMNRARTLLLGMLVVGFTALVIGPTCVWLVGTLPRAGDGRGAVPTAMLLFVGCQIAGPVILLVILDWLSRHVVADRPGKFGPGVPTVGKWGS